MTVKRYVARIDGRHLQVVDSETDAVVYSSTDATAAAHLMVRWESEARRRHAAERASSIVRQGRPNPAQVEG